MKHGELEDRKIEINVKQSSPAGIGMVGNGMMDEASMAGIQDMLSNMMPKRTKKEKSPFLRPERF